MKPRFREREKKKKMGCLPNRSWYKYASNHPLAYLLNQFSTGHHSLNASRALIVPCFDSRCLCGVQETFSHYLFQCERYCIVRYQLLNSVNSITGRSETRLQGYNLKDMFGQSRKMSGAQKTKMVEALLNFFNCTR